MRPSASLALALLLTACGGGEGGDDAGLSGGDAARPGVDGSRPALDAGSSGGDGGGSDGGGGDDAGAPADDAGATTDCTPSLDAGDHTLTLDFDGRERTFHVHVPAGHGGALSPLVIDLHGYLEDADRQDGRSGLRAKSDEEGFLAVQPEGFGGAQSWNGGACCGTAASSDLDDVGLMRAIVDDVAGRACVDRRRVYATGMSNGGFLAHRIACEAADVFAAVAPVAGVIGVDRDGCTPARPIPVFHTHGLADPVVPYNGNVFVSYPSVASTMEHWVDANGCDADPSATETIDSATCETWTGCDAGVEVRLCSVSGEFHAWPESLFPATDQIWAFFQRHALP